MNKNELLSRLTDRQKKYEWIITDETFRYKDKISYVCYEKDELGREHGIQNITVAKVLRGDGCPICNGRGMDKDLFVYKSTIIHKSLYTYDKFDFIDKQTEGEIYCTKHQIYFKQKPSKHLMGQGCPICRYEKSAKSKTKTTEKFIKDAKSIFDDKYDYSDTRYSKDDEEVTVICHKKDTNGIEHGKFSIIASNHLQGHGCPMCGREKTIESRKKDFNEFVKTARKIHGNKYTYIESDYTKASNEVTIVCPIHGDFKQKGTNHTCLHQGCPKCSNQQSLAEEEIVDYIHNTLGINDIITRNRNIIPPLELDIYIPSKNIAIEFNGLYWHCELYTGNNYHLNKTNRCIEKGIRLIHIFEDEWNEKKDIVKGNLSIILGKPSKIILAEDCTLSKVENNDAKFFLNNNHIKGSCEVKYNFGLYYNKELVLLMSFNDAVSQKKSEQNTDYEYELKCFCEKNDILIVGGISKLFKYSNNNLNAKEIVTYVDKRWSNGKHYNELGFTHTYDILPDYFYVINSGHKRYKQTDFCSSQKRYRIFDCGYKCYKWFKE